LERWESLDFSTGAARRRGEICRKAATTVVAWKPDSWEKQKAVNRNSKLFLVLKKEGKMTVSCGGSGHLIRLVDQARVQEKSPDHKIDKKREKSS
jgi:hypothetical protein